jgi:hypothetical protein
MVEDYAPFVSAVMGAKRARTVACLEACHRLMAEYDPARDPQEVVWLIEALRMPYHAGIQAWVDTETEACCVRYSCDGRSHDEAADNFPQAVRQLGVWLRAGGLQRPNGSGVSEGLKANHEEVADAAQVLP